MFVFINYLCSLEGEKKKSEATSDLSLHTKIQMESVGLMLYCKFVNSLPSGRLNHVGTYKYNDCVFFFK